MLGDNCGKVTVTTVERCLVRTEIVKLFIKLIRSGQAWKYPVILKVSVTSVRLLRVVGIGIKE